MDMRWSLAELYSSFDSAEYKADLQEFDRIIIDTNEGIALLMEKKDSLTDVEIIEILEKQIKENIHLSGLVDKLYSFASLTNSTDVKNSESIKYTQLLQSKFVKLTDANV
ncbi:MAG: hypothetical protein B6226_03345, partial [Candidatus Cloacimonetes bacterium 4572_65]